MANKSNIVTFTLIRREVNDILLEGRSSPNGDGIYRHKRIEVFRVNHCTHDDAVCIVASIDINGRPEMHLALVKCEVSIECVSQSRRSHIDILTCRNLIHRICLTIETDYSGIIFREFSKICILSTHVDIWHKVAGIGTPSPLKIFTNFSSLIRQVTIIVIRHVLSRFYTEVVAFRIVPCTGFSVTDRANEDVVVLTGNEFYIDVLLQTRFGRIMESELLCRDFRNGIRVDKVFGDDDLEFVSVPACSPSDVYVTSAEVVDDNVMRHGTFRS